MQSTQPENEDWQSIQARLERAAEALKAAQQQKCEAMYEFLAAREAARRHVADVFDANTQRRARLHSAKGRH